jgi:hypothetical protein
MQSGVMTRLTPHHVTLAALETVLHRIVASYRQRGIDSVDLSERDLYRAFGTGEMFDVYADAPSPIGIGSLHDDISELSKLLADPEGFPTAVDIERLGNALRAVSEII